MYLCIVCVYEMCIDIVEFYLQLLIQIIFRVLVFCGDTGVGSIIVQLCCYLNCDVTVACPSRASYFMKYLGANSTCDTETISVDQLLCTAPNG